MIYVIFLLNIPITVYFIITQRFLNIYFKPYKMRSFFLNFAQKSAIFSNSNYLFSGPRGFYGIENAGQFPTP